MDMFERFLIAAAATAVVGCGSLPPADPDSGTGSDARTPDARTPDAGTSDAPDPGPWNPGKLPNLALWLVADTGVTTNNSRVTTWADRSGNNNNAAQSVIARQPTLVTGVVNGQPVVRFDGTDDALQVTDSATLQFGTGDFTI